MKELSKITADKDWWRGAVIYQIYPRSYQDSSGNGIGDLVGITERLPYIARLGVDAIWISPFFKSPMKDFGYDVSDYCDVDPMFGTLSDFDALLETAHGLGVRVMIDLVLSHTSDQHPWFAQSRADQSNDKANWYVWADPQPDGSAPNNWLSIFGGPAWHWDTRREQYYLHNFLATQPDLNFHEPAVQDALLDVTRFWLDRGVDGFRLDTINFYFHDAHLRSNPALPAEARNATIAPSVNPYNYQDHVYSKNQPENLGFLKRFRDLLDTYPAAAAVGEVGDAQRGLEIMGAYTREGQGVHMCYAFEFLCAEPLTARRVVDVFAQLQEEAPDGWPCWAFSNHDVVRHVTRWNLSDKAARMFVTVLMCLRGSVCIYQGEELGLPEAEVDFDDLQDPYGIEFWPEFKGRDGCRTPMVWATDNSNGGFSTSATWLPVDARHLQLSVESQQNREESLLEYYRYMIAKRRNSVLLTKGDQENMRYDGDILSFERKGPSGRVFVAFNFGETFGSVRVPAGNWKATEGGPDAGTAWPLGAWDSLILEEDA